MNLLENRIKSSKWLPAQFLKFQTTLLLFFPPNFAIFKNTALLPQTPFPAIIGQPFIALPSVESTNNYAMGRVQSGLASHGTAVFAHHQTAGKGQRGKSWFSAPGENLILTVILRPRMDLTPFQFSAMVALACRDWYLRHAKSEVFVKWPNDIYWRDRKAGGILIENSFREKEWQWAVTGIGININQTQFPASIKKAVSLKQITGRAFDAQLLAEDLCGFLDKAYNTMAADNIINEYNRALYKRGEIVKLKKDTAIFETRIREVNESGELITEDVMERTIRFGEVEWI